MKFVFVETVDEVLEAALQKRRTTTSRKSKATRSAKSAPKKTPKSKAKET